MTDTKSLPYDWEQDIAPCLEGLQSADGGYTVAKRGTITLADGSEVFVKLATDDLTREWLQKEIQAYQLLNMAGYPYIPKLLAINPDTSGMAIEHLEADFSDTWDKVKLEAVVAAQEALKQHVDLFKGNPLFKPDSVVNLDDKWPVLVQSGNIDALNKKLIALSVDVVLTQTQAEGFAEQLSGWSIRKDTLVHQDIRADNFGYDPKTKTGKLVDWNWLCVGDESLDTTPLFINMRLLGFDPFQYHPEKLDRNMVVFLMGYWLEVILHRDVESGDQNLKLRKRQAQNIQVCLELLAK